MIIPTKFLVLWSPIFACPKTYYNPYTRLNKWLQEMDTVATLLYRDHLPGDACEVDVSVSCAQKCVKCQVLVIQKTLVSWLFLLIQIWCLGDTTRIYLVLSTDFKKICLSIWIISPRFGVNVKNMFFKPPPSHGRNSPHHWKTEKRNIHEPQQNQKLRSEIHVNSLAS